MNRFSLRALLLVGATAISAAPASYAFAQAAPAPVAGSQLEEVVVTARRREENLQTTPVAITALTASTLESRNVVSLVDISRIAPSLQVISTSGSVGSAGMYMRGIGFGDNVIGQDSPIGVYVDGIALGRLSTAVMDLVQPDRVEVLRGPQGTLFGRNTTAGAIVISTHTPTNEFSGEVKATYGSYAERGVMARIDTGLLGNTGIKASMAYSHRQKNGYQNNGLTPRNLDPGAISTDAFWFRAQGEWGNIRANLTGDYSETDGVPAMLQIVDAPSTLRNFFANSVANGGSPFTVTQDPQYKVANYAVSPEQHIWSQGIALNLEYRATDYLTVKSITGIRAYRRNDAAAYGPANFRVPLLTGGVGTFNGAYGFPLRMQSQNQVSEELQALGEVGDFNYVAGLYFFHETGWDAARTIIPAATGASTTAAFLSDTPRYYEVDSKSRAAFAQVDWRPEALDKKLEVTGGIRWTKDTREFTQTIPLIRGAKLNTKNTSFLVSANYQWTDGLMTYVRYSTGYRAGGFNVRAAATANPVYQPEKIKALEGGFKLDALDRRLRLNGSAYFNKYSDLQVSQFAPPGATTGGGSNTINANAEFKGFELELTAIPVERLTVSASLGYVDVKYKRFPTGLIGGAVSPGCSPLSANGVNFAQDCAGIAKFASAPKTTADVGATYEFETTAYGVPSARVNYSYRGKTQWGTLDLPTTPFAKSIVGKSYGLLDARVALSEIPLGNTRAQLAVFGKNLTNEEYTVQGIDFVIFATRQFGERRTFGIEGKVDF